MNKNLTNNFLYDTSRKYVSLETVNTLISNSSASLMKSINNLLTSNNIWTGTNDFQTIPTTLTANIGDNTTKIATTKFVNENYIGLTGDQTINGIKTFSSSPIVPSITANTNIIANTSINTPILDTLSSVALTIGSTNASSINIGSSSITTNIVGNIVNIGTLTKTTNINTPLSPLYSYDSLTGTTTSGSIGYIYKSNILTSLNIVSGAFYSLVFISSLPAGVYILNFTYNLTNSDTQILISQSESRIGTSNINNIDSYNIIRESVPLSLEATDNTIHRVITFIYNTTTTEPIYANYISTYNNTTLVLNNPVLTATRIA